MDTTTTNIPNDSTTTTTTTATTTPKPSKLKCSIHFVYCRKVEPLSGVDSGRIYFKCKVNACSFSKWFDTEHDVHAYNQQRQYQKAPLPSQQQQPIQQQTIQQTPTTNTLTSKFKPSHVSPLNQFNFSDDDDIFTSADQYYNNNNNTTPSSKHNNNNNNNNNGNGSVGSKRSLNNSFDIITGFYNDEDSIFDNDPIDSDFNTPNSAKKRLVFDSPNGNTATSIPSNINNNSYNNTSPSSLNIKSHNPSTPTINSNHSNINSSNNHNNHHNLSNHKPIVNNVNNNNSNQKNSLNVQPVLASIPLTKSPLGMHNQHSCSMTQISQSTTIAPPNLSNKTATKTTATNTNTPSSAEPSSSSSSMDMNTDITFDLNQDTSNLDNSFDELFEKSKKEREIKIQQQQFQQQLQHQQQKQQKLQQKQQQIQSLQQTQQLTTPQNQNSNNNNNNSNNKCIPIEIEDDEEVSITGGNGVSPKKPNLNNGNSKPKTRLAFDTDVIEIPETALTPKKSNNDNSTKSYRVESIDVDLKWNNIHNQPKVTVKPKRNTANQVIVDFQFVDKDAVGTSYPVPLLIPETEEIIQIFKNAKGVRNVKEETWRFALNEYQGLVNMLKLLQSRYSRFQLNVIPSEVFKYLFDPWYIEKTKMTVKQQQILNQQQQQFRHAPFDCTKIPVELFTTLLPFQMKSLTFCTQQLFGRCLIGDEMGLGKTIQALAIASYYRDQWPLLIICPSSLRLSWSREVEKWFTDLAGDISVIMTSEDKANSMVNIVSYDLVGRILEKELIPKGFKAIICDESHYMKNSDAKRTKNVLKLITNANIRILLTGTPALSRPVELFPQMLALGTPIYSTLKDFGLRYCNAFKGRYGWDYTGNSHLQELYVLIRGVMIRRLKNDVLKDLPQKVRIKVVVDTPAPAQVQNEISNVFSKSNKLSMIRQSMGANGNGGVEEKTQIMKLYIETGRAKLKASCDYIKNLIKEKEKFLVFAHHSDIMNGLEEAIQSTRVGYIRIDGTTPAVQRQSFVNKFQNNQSCRVALLSITAAGTGLTLTASNLVVFVELYWTPGVLRQAEDRIHRIGQTKTCYIHYLIGKNTLDDRIWPTICNKLEVLGETLDGQEEVLHTQNLDIRNGAGVVSRAGNTISKYFIGKDGTIDLEKEDTDELVFTLIGDDPDIITNNLQNQNNNDEDEDEEDGGGSSKKKKANSKQKKDHKPTTTTTTTSSSTKQQASLKFPQAPPQYHSQSQQSQQQPIQKNPNFIDYVKNGITNNINNNNSSNGNSNFILSSNNLNFNNINPNYNNLNFNNNQNNNNLNPNRNRNFNFNFRQSNPNFNNIQNNNLNIPQQYNNDNNNNNNNNNNHNNNNNSTTSNLNTISNYFQKK